MTRPLTHKKWKLVSAQDVVGIFRDIKQGKTVQETSDKYGVTKGAIYYWCTRAKIILPKRKVVWKEVLELMEKEGV